MYFKKEEYKKTKQYLKELVKIIRFQKSIRKMNHKNHDQYDVNKLRDVRREFRHFNIAFLELRGKTREQIEPYCRPDNQPSEYLITKIKDDLMERILEENIDENVCVG